MGQMHITKAGPAILIGLFLFVAPMARAQDSTAASRDSTDHAMDVTSAKEAALAWLAIVDKGSFGQSWDQAAVFFRGAVGKDQWITQLKSVRSPLGEVQSRDLVDGSYYTSLPMAPEGEYVVLSFRTSFEHHGGGTETVTPMKDPDGAWRVAGYYMK